MTALYVLVQEHRELAKKLQESGLDEQTIADTMDAMSGPLEEKAQSYAMISRMRRADTAAIRQWAKDALERAAIEDKVTDRIEQRLADGLMVAGITHVTGPGVSISFRASSSVVIDGEDLIPTEYMRQPDPPAPAPDKKAIAEAFKAGKEVPGAHIEHKRNIQIK